MKQYIFLIFSIAYYSNVSFSQNDTLIWEKDMNISIQNRTEGELCNTFKVGYLGIISPEDSVQYYRAILSQKNSWLCLDIDDESEIELAYYVLSLTELWSRKLNVYLTQNKELPTEYLIAYKEESWEQHLKLLDKEIKRFQYGTDTTGLNEEISKIVNAIEDIQNPIEVNKPTPYGYGMDFFTSSAYSTSGIFSNPIGMGISLQFFAKKTGVKLQGNFMYGTTQKAPEGSKILIDGQRIQHGEFTIQVEHRIIENYYINFSPYIGYGYYEIQAIDSLSGSSQVAKSAAQLQNYSPCLGLNIDYKLRGQFLNTEKRYGSDSYWLIRAGISYIPYMKAEGEAMSFWGFKLGLGGFSKFWN